MKDCGIYDSIKIRPSSELDYLKQVPEQLTQVAQYINKLSKDNKQLSVDLSLAEQKVQNLEMKYSDIITEEAQARDK
jgi:hypothetical protein